MHAYLLWLALAAYGIHVLEEFMLDWRGWARRVLKLPVEWSTFYVVNSLVVVLGITTAEIGWQLPEYSLMFPALMVVNATFFHVLPTLRTMIFSPGLVTAVLLFYPIAAACYWGAKSDGVLSAQAICISTLGGILLMATPIVLLKVKDRPVFQQE